MGLDLALAGIVLLMAIRGWLKGFTLQAIRLGGMVACVYLADPVRDQARPYALHHLPSIRPELVDRLLWWASAVLSLVVIVGLTSLFVKMVKRANPLGEPEPKRTDQVGGMLLGILKGLVVAAFVAAGTQKYALVYFKNLNWIQTQAQTSKALVWNEKYQPVPRIWASRPVQHFVGHVQRMGLSSPSDKTSEEADQPPESDPPVKTAVRSPKLAVPSGGASTLDPTSLDPEVIEAVKSIQEELRKLERPN